ncbi:MAG: hypothetical protein JNG88_02585 [Phycisphaerales bacterium]|nr:hypothetical protein [Phycisphaerales bacterium]
MVTPLRIRQLNVLALAVPMRLKFEHAAASRSVADPVVVQAIAATPFAHFAGWGETLARPYVSGETPATVLRDIRELFVPRLADFQPGNWAEALEFIDALPMMDGERIVTAARAAIELALLDLCGRVFQRRLTDVVGWMGLGGFGAPGCIRAARYSGVVVGRSKTKLQWLLRAQRWYGLRDFKIKVATPGWEQRLEWAYRVLRPALESGRATLRADANGAWTFDEAVEHIPTLRLYGVSALEQPLSDQHDHLLPRLRQVAPIDLIADESMVTMEDARRLVGDGAVQVLNIRLAKNGGLMPALRLAKLALQSGIDVQLGCLVGETSILSAAGIAFLECCPSARFVEGAFGRLLLRADVTRRPIRFGRGGRIKPRAGHGLGLSVDETLVAELKIDVQ